MALEADILSKLKKRKILVVDDERFSRSIIVRALDGVEVEQAGDGGEALHILTKLPDQIGLVICDFNMPVMDGLRFLKSVRSGLEGITHTLPVIMLTGNSDSGLVKAALQLDVDAFVVKPVAITPLHGRIRHVLTQQQDLKSPQHYAGINVEDISSQLLAPAQAMSTWQQPQEETPPPGASKVALADIPIGSTLANDVLAAKGQVLVAAGVTLSERLVNRLKELNSIGVCPGDVWITPAG